MLTKRSARKKIRLVRTLRTTNKIAENNLEKTEWRIFEFVSVNPLIKVCSNGNLKLKQLFVDVVFHLHCLFINRFVLLAIIYRDITPYIFIIIFIYCSRECHCDIVLFIIHIF